SWALVCTRDSGGCFGSPAPFSVSVMACTSNEEAVAVPPKRKMREPSRAAEYGNWADGLSVSREGVPVPSAARQKRLGLPPLTGPAVQMARCPSDVQMGL